MTTRTEETIQRLAARQFGVVARSQLLGAGVASHIIDYRVKTGGLRPIHRGVYLAGRVAVPLQREMAAVLACGRGAALSHRTAAGVWGLVPPPRSGATVHVSGPRSLRGPGGGVRLHRVARLDEDEVTRRHGLPITTAGRTLLDLASCADAAELERALARAEREHLITLSAMRELVRRRPGRRGCRTLRRILDSLHGPALTRSEAEARFLDLARRGGLPRPRTNVVVGNLEVDFLWPDHRLVVEIDGFRYHSGRTAFERDRDRDADLVAAGLRVMRFTWRQLTAHPETVLVRLARALEAGMSPAGRPAG